MRWVAVIIGMVSALVFASVAQAGWREDRALQIANAVWHQPCGGQMQITWGWPAGTPDPGEGALAETLPGRSCLIYMAPNVSQPWPLFCSLVLHEAGHLAGYRDPSNTADPDHSTNPRSVMSAEMNSDRGYDSSGRVTYPGADPRCADRGVPFLAAVTARAGRAASRSASR